jgi:hypothetical protein
VGVAVYALYRPHGSFAAGAVAIAAGVYEFTPLRQRFRRRCRESVRTGFEFGVYCVGSSIGLTLMLVALGVMSVTCRSDCRSRRRPEAPARESRHRCAAGVGDRRAWHSDRHRALVGSRTHATDVRRHRWAGPRQAVVTTRRRETMTDHKTGTREEWLAARLELLEAEKALTRRGDEVARQRQELALGSHRQGVPLRDRRRHSVPRRSLQRTLAAAHLSLHVRARLHGRVSVLLGDRGRLRRLRRSPRESRCHALRGVTGSACCPALKMSTRAALRVSMFGYEKTPPGGFRAGSWCSRCRGGVQSAVTSATAARVADSSTMVLSAA